MSMANQPLSIFQVAGRAMSAQLVRMNAAASNLANAGSVAGSEAAAYHPLRPVFAQQLDAATGLATVRVSSITRSSESVIMRHDPAQEHDDPTDDSLIGDRDGRGRSDRPERLRHRA